MDNDALHAWLNQPEESRLAVLDELWGMTLAWAKHAEDDVDTATDATTLRHAYDLLASFTPPKAP